MQAKRIVAAAVLVLIAFLVVLPPLVNGGVKVALASSSAVSVEHLYLTIGEVRGHRAGTGEPSGWSSVSNASRQIDLAVVNATQTVALGSLSLGEYDKIRVRVTNATAIMNNTSKKVQLASSVFTIPVAFLVQFGVETPVTLNVTPVLEETPNGMTLRLSFAPATTGPGT